MLAARLGAWLRHTGERWAKAAFAEKLAVLLALGAILYTIVTGAAELRYQARAREALAQVKAARLAASAVSAQCYSAGQTFADQTSADGFADGIAEEIRTLGSLPGTVTLLQIDPNGYTVQRLLYQENGMYAIYDADRRLPRFPRGGPAAIRRGGGPCCCLSFCWDSFVFCWARRCSAL